MFYLSSADFTVDFYCEFLLRILFEEAKMIEQNKETKLESKTREQNNGRSST